MQDSPSGAIFPAVHEYLMESEDEVIRLEIKTDPQALFRQASWCGVKSGMRVLDCGCGPGKTTALLHDMVLPGGSIVGIDFSPERIAYARKNYGDRNGISFSLQNFLEPMETLGQFDLIWVRFVLEYFQKEAQDIVNNLKKNLKPGGILCLVDLDFNCMIHYGLPAALSSAFAAIMENLDERYNFDTFIGRKLYSFLYDGGFENIEVELMAHNLIYGEIREKDRFNFSKKMEIASKKTSAIIEAYPGGSQQFCLDIKTYLANPRRFTYTPLLLCKGLRPSEG